MKLTKAKKRLFVVLGTILGLLALFLFIVFVPIDNNANQDIMSEEVVENELVDEEAEEAGIDEQDNSDISGMEGKKQTDGEVTDEQSNSSERKTNEIEIPVPDEDVEYRDSSEFVDSEYTNYTDDPPVDEKDGNVSSDNDTATDEDASNDYDTSTETPSPDNAEKENVNSQPDGEESNASDEGEAYLSDNGL